MTTVAPHGLVPVRLGPLPSEDVLAWIHDVMFAMNVSASGVLGKAIPFRVGEEFFAANRAVLEVWRAKAAAGDGFEWSGEADPDWIVTMLQWWHNLALVRRDLMDRRIAPPAPPGAERVGAAVRSMAYDVLLATGRMTPAKAARMEASWPRLGPGAVTATVDADPSGGGPS